MLGPGLREVIAAHPLEDRLNSKGRAVGLDHTGVEPGDVEQPAEQAAERAD